MQITSKYLGCSVTKIIKNKLKYNKINVLAEVVALKKPFGYRRLSVFLITKI